MRQVQRHARASCSNDRSAEALRLAGQILSQLRYGRISDIFAAGLHEYLTDYLDVDAGALGARSRRASSRRRSPD